jgi:ATP-dependent Clp endopeptidase proteolytic subunit ClpP
MSAALPPLPVPEAFTDLDHAQQWFEAALAREKFDSEARQNRFYKTTPVARGRFVLDSAVAPASVARTISDMDTWSANHPGEDMTLVINSPGGVVIDGFALYDFCLMLKQRGHKIITEGLGMQASMGGILLQAGDERQMSPRSWMLIHEVQGVAAGSLAEMEDTMRFNERLQEQAIDILAGRSTFTKEEIKSRWERKDWWLSAEDALAGGFIDTIIAL